MSTRRPYCTPDGQVVSQLRQVRQRSRCSCVLRGDRVAFEHLLDQVDAAARAVELVAEQLIGRAGRGAEAAMHALAQDRVGLLPSGVSDEIERVRFASVRCPGYIRPRIEDALPDRTRLLQALVYPRKRRRAADGTRRRDACVRETASRGRRRRGAVARISAGGAVARSSAARRAIRSASRRGSAAARSAAPTDATASPRSRVASEERMRLLAQRLQKALRRRPHRSPPSLRLRRSAPRPRAGQAHRQRAVAPARGARSATAVRPIRSVRRIARPRQRRTAAFASAPDAAATLSETSRISPSVPSEPASARETS